jgi:hypothetical protein
MTMAFDTLKFAHRLEQVGVPRGQAEAHAELARDMIIADVATKSDLADLRTSTKADLAAAVKDLATKGDLAAVVKDFQASLAKLEGKLKLLDQRMTIRLGAMLAAAAGIIVLLQKSL